MEWPDYLQKLTDIYADLKQDLTQQNILFVLTVSKFTPAR